MERVKALEQALKEAKEGAMKDRKRFVMAHWTIFLFCFTFIGYIVLGINYALIN